MADPKDQLATMIANMPEKTGKSLEEWTEFIRAAGLEKHGAIMKVLKGEHGVTHGFANMISNLARKAMAPTPEGDPETALVDAQYAGGKADLRPLLDSLLKHARGFGDDVLIAPKKTSVSFRRAKQFAVVTPATKTRVDVGIQLKGEPATERLKAAGGMTSHKVGITELSQIDEELIGWLREAYGRCG